MKYSMLLPVLAFTACGDKTGETIIEEEVASDSGDWWDVGGGDSDGGSAQGDDGDDEDKPDDTGKPDDGDKPEGASSSWLATISLVSGEGALEISSDDGEGTTCTLTYPVTESAGTEDCSDCAFAYQLTLAEAVISDDGGGCEEWLGLDSAPLLYGQGSSSLGEYGGIEFFNLYVDKGTGWAELTGGYSSHQNQGEDSELWEFGIK
jgi:hypothetical protein